MRDFCKFSPKFWMHSSTRAIIQQGSEATTVAIYLQTNHHSHSLGIYFLPLEYIARDTGISLKKIKVIMQNLEGLDFCQYDYIHEYVWLINYGLEQAGGPLKKEDNRCTQIQKYVEELPNLKFLSKFYSQHQGDFHLSVPLEGEDSPFEPARKPLLSKEKEKEKEKNKKKEKKNTIASMITPEGALISKIFEHWKAIMTHPHAKLDKSREKLIRNAIDAGYDEAQLCQAVTGCSYTPHNMGFNDNGQRYDGLHIIFRNADQIDRFIANYHAPPKKMSKQDALLQHNEMAVEAWLKESEDLGYDPH